MDKGARKAKRSSSYRLCDELEYWIERELNRRKTLKLRHASKNEILNDWAMGWVGYLRHYYPNLYPAASANGVAVEVRAVDPANETKLAEWLERGISLGFQKMP